MLKVNLLLICFFSLRVNSQDVEVNQNKIPQDLVNRLKGIKYAAVNLSKDRYDAFKRNEASLSQVETIGKYLKDKLNIQSFSYIPDETKSFLKNVNSSCELTWIGFDPGRFVATLGALGNYYDARLSFHFCDNKTYIIRLEPISVSGMTYWPTRLYKALSRIPFPKMQYSKLHQIKLLSYDSVINRLGLEKYLKSKNHFYEGIFKSVNMDVGYEIGIINTNDTIKVVYLSGGYKEDWFEGEHKAFLKQTKSEKTFFADWIKADKSLIKDLLLTFDDENRFTLTIGEQKDIYIRIL